jgi:hypothetical protein
MVLVLEVDPAESGRFRTLSNVCKYYRVPVLLAAAGLRINRPGTAAEVGWRYCPLAHR